MLRVDVRSVHRTLPFDDDLVLARLQPVKGIGSGRPRGHLVIRLAVGLGDAVSVIVEAVDAHDAAAQAVFRASLREVTVAVCIDSAGDLGTEDLRPHRLCGGHRQHAAAHIVLVDAGHTQTVGVDVVLDVAVGTEQQSVRARRIGVEGVRIEAQRGDVLGARLGLGCDDVRRQFLPVRARRGSAIECTAGCVLHTGRGQLRWRWWGTATRCADRRSCRESGVCRDQRR